MAKWLDDRAPRLGAALAYYTVFSLSPLLILVIAVGGLVFGREAAQGQIVGQIQSLVGREDARTIQAMIESGRKPAPGILASLFGLAALLIGASGVFGELHDALNGIWEIKSPSRGLTGLIKDRFLSFTMVPAQGFCF